MSDTLRDRLAEVWDDGRPLATLDSVIRKLTEGIEVVTPHRFDCEYAWCRAWWPPPKDIARRGPGLYMVCKGRMPSEVSCPAEARIPEALLVSLVEAKEGS